MRLVLTNLTLVEPPLEESMLVQVKVEANHLTTSHTTHHQDEVIMVEIPEVVLIGIMGVGPLEEVLC